jgi:hypothetical protein
MTFTLRLERLDGAAADPPTFRTVAPRWEPGDTIPLGAKKALRVVRLRDDDADQPPVLVVEDVAERASSAEL